MITLKGNTARLFKRCPQSNDSKPEHIQQTIKYLLLKSDFSGYGHVIEYEQKLSQVDNK